MLFYLFTTRVPISKRAFLLCGSALSQRGSAFTLRRGSVFTLHRVCSQSYPSLSTLLKMSVQAACLGFPRMGPKRELKKLVEGYWAGKVSVVELLDGARDLSLRHWKIQKDAGISIIPSNDASLYDHVLVSAFVEMSVIVVYR